MNQEQLNAWKSAAQKSDGLVRIYAEDLLAIIALAERALLAAAPAPIQQAPQTVQLVTTTYAKAHSTTVIVNLVKGNVTTCLYSADHSANGKTIGVSDLPDGLSLAVKQPPEPCGGCGETDPSKRCIGCRHPFSEPSPAVAGEPATPPALAGSQAQAAVDVLAERERQKQQEGWMPERDDKYIDCELARAAATYSLCTDPEQIKVCGAPVWPWPIYWWKPTTYRRNLVKAGALILAEIERLDRAAMREQP